VVFFGKLCDLIEINRPRAQTQKQKARAPPSVSLLLWLVVMAVNRAHIAVAATASVRPIDRNAGSG
jgi:hypothetical protein